jgi:hypothetical protein
LNYVYIKMIFLGSFVKTNKYEWALVML